MKNLICSVAILILILGQTALAQTDWKQTNGPSGGKITYLTKDSRGYLYALASNSNVYISKDNGDHWNKIFEGIYAIGMDKNNNCYTIGSLGSFTIYDENLKNGITSEEPFNEYRYAKTIVIDNNFNIYVTTEWGGLWITSDKGVTWSDLPSVSKYDIALDTNNILLVTYGNDSIGRSTNNGRDWKHIKVADTNFRNRVSHVTYNKQFGNFIATGLFGFVYISTDSGLNWTISPDTLPDELISMLFVDDYGNTYITGNKLSYQSTDGGFSWYKNDSIPFGWATTSYKNYLYIAGTRYKLVRYDLNSKSVEEKNEGIYNQTVIFIVANNKGYVYAKVPHELFRTTDDGESWQKLPFPKGKSEFSFPIICTKNNFIFAGMDSTVQRSSDDGNSWLTVFSDSTYKVSFSEADNGRIYMAKTYLYYSEDNGNSWIQQYSFGTGIVSLSIYQNKYFVACSYYGYIYFSDDSAKTFRALPLSVPEHCGSVATFNKTGDVFISLREWGDWALTVFSDDMCQSFREIDKINDPLDFMKIDNNNNLYTNRRTNGKNDGLNFTSDKGITWHALNNPAIQDKQIYDMCFVKNGAYLASIGYSVFKTDYLMDVDDPKCITVSDLDISPNPASDFIEISVGANGSSPLQSEVRIFDVYGQTVSPAGGGVSSADGGGCIRIDVSGLPQGMYFVRVGDRVEKFVKI
jgi:photosystem II stability/assembly factor-like uncharacterized protein